MIVSWNWLKQYVTLDMSQQELEQRLMFAGLNHEESHEVGGDIAIDLEVTSNRPDCLGHIGIARETATLWGSELKIPAAAPKECATNVNSLTKVRIECPDICLRYTARVIRGAKIGPSPKWMVRRLETIGIAPINNVVDISNYVLMECGQPLHTFDYDKLEGGEIVVRRPRSGETIEAINHKTYALSPNMCLICDARSPVAIGGVMGGASTEVTEATKSILIESAEFDPVSIRATARELNLHSDSSYRFERRVDPEGLDWASRRCCELILELAGGELAEGVVDVGREPPERKPITLRFSQLKRILGIEVPAERVREILEALGSVVVDGSYLKTDVSDKLSGETRSSVTVVAPSWRRDLTREIDLIEEVARIHGYEQIPEDVAVPMVASSKQRDDRVLPDIRRLLAAAGINEALTLSVVDETLSSAFSPWTNEEPLRSQMPVIRGANCLRRSLVPSLLAARRVNESLSNPEIELFEIARAYLPRPGQLPQEELMLAITSGRSFAEVKGIIEAVLDSLKCTAKLEVKTLSADLPLLDGERSCELFLDGRKFGFIGAASAEALKQFELRGKTTIAEVRASALVELAQLVPQYAPMSSYPPVTRDVNLVVDEALRWADVAETVYANGGEFFEKLEFCGDDAYRHERLGVGKKSFLFTVLLRGTESTLTSQQADDVRDRIVEACRKKHGAELRA